MVYSKPHKEQQAQFHFGLQGIESFFPRLYLPRSVKKKGQDCKGARGQCVPLVTALSGGTGACGGLSESNLESSVAGVQAAMAKVITQRPCEESRRRRAGVAGERTRSDVRRRSLKIVG